LLGAGLYAFGQKMKAEKAIEQNNPFGMKRICVFYLEIALKEFLGFILLHFQHTGNQTMVLEVFLS
jgi:hypothetical protein